jgi:phage shock protein A
MLNIRVVGLLILLFLVLLPTDAFLVRPPIPTSRFILKPGSAGREVYKPRHFNPPIRMGIIDRTWRAFRSQINGLLKYFEDPQKILEQCIIDMNSDLIRVRQSYAEIAASHRKAINERETIQKKIVELHDRAQLAMKRNDENLARQALAIRQDQLSLVEQLNKQIDMQDSILSKLQESMTTLEMKIIESKREKDTIIARSKAAQSTLKVNEMLQSLSSSFSASSNSADAYSTMKERVLALEAEAEVSGQMTVVASNSLETKFQDLEKQSKVDAELARLKISSKSAATVPLFDERRKFTGQ